MSRSSGSERAGLAQNQVGNGHLADIMQKRGAGDLRQQRRFHLHVLGDGDGEGRNALAVAFGFSVFQVERPAQGLQRVVVGLFELLERALQLRGAFFHQFFQIALVIAIFQHQAAVFQGAADAQVKLVFFKRLQNVVVGAAADGFQRG